MVRQSWQAMGGDAWASVKTLQLESYGNSQQIDESERPEGPFIPVQQKAVFVQDLVHHKGLLTLSQKTYTFEGAAKYVMDESVVAQKRGSRLLPTEQNLLEQDDMVLAPEHLYEQALQAKDLRYVKDTMLQKADHACFSFHWGSYPVLFYLNKETDLLTAVTVIKPYTNTFGIIWGDSRRTNFYSFWNMIGKGLHYPLQRDSYLNGWYQSSNLIWKWQVNPEVGEDSLSIPDSVRVQISGMADRARAAQRQALDRTAKEIAPGVWLLPGFCNSTVIDQGDGLVVIEAPVSSDYAELIQEKARKLFPGKKIKALLSNSDAWLHIGGTRAYAAIPGIRIYHPFRNQFILEKLLTAEYVTSLDAYARQGRHDYRLVPVKDSMVVGSGDNQVVLYPYHTETGDRMMMVFFPHRGLLYTSDLYQPKNPDGSYWQPHYAWEVYQSIRRLGLPVQQFYGMHTMVLPYADLEKDFKDDYR